VRNLASFKTSLNFDFETPAFENTARILKQKCNAAMIDLYVMAKFGEVECMHVHMRKLCQF